VSLFGPLRCRRAYYYCRRCGQGFAPWDEQVGLTERNLTPAARRLASLAGGVADSFGKGTDLLQEMAALDLSESTVERTTEATGAQIAQALAQGKTFGSAKDWEWHRDYDGCRCAYVGLDGIVVPQQGPQGSKAEGKQAYVGVLFNPRPEYGTPPTKEAAPFGVQARYVSGTYELGDLEAVLRQQGAQIGMDRAERWIGLSDGGNGLENRLESAFPRVEVVILDYWHASEYLAELARALHPQEEALAEGKRRLWGRLLKEEGGRATLAYLREEAWPAAGAVAEQWRKVATYFENQQHRMDYPEYEARGWCIGSGMVESGCKTVVAQRLKLAGMRWGEEGTDAVCHVRALYRSETAQWKAFWTPPSPN
jgi:hypothetical protein